MRLDSNEKERVLTAARVSGMTTVALKRIEDRWFVVGTDPEFPGAFVVRIVGEVTPDRVWWTGGWFNSKRKRDAIAEACAFIGVAPPRRKVASDGQEELDLDPPSGVD